MAAAMTGGLSGAASGNVPDLKNTVLWGGLAAGALDATDGVVAYGFLGQNPIQVLQYIASGALGKESFNGGLATAAAGAAIHFLIAFTVAAVYYVAAKKIPLLISKPVTCGLLFGASVYLAMNYLVLPFSRVPASPFLMGLFLNGIIGHALFVGLPIALFARREGRR